ncbi:NAD-dependent epimerase/dehydratase family protein [Roseivirga thermotolerans]|uniref:Dihydroflavonol 4-reductase n=1 Tax=Roseivirga thermotolerans TaxID=1758176 RepID=A0ABQ3I0I6_9BACT|nr:NAD-dependent epimerase/dehydratase family protein [Roseivirga thermotolerans]GHE53159.1 dihydroflavonol 4-reductase [Roseivirga thermotolerans]
MKVFVTGATGLLGSFICRELLQKGHQIRAVKRAASQMTLLEDIAGQIEWVIGDMNDTVFLESALTGIDAVIHGAAIISFDKRFESKMYETNVLGTADLVNTCLKLNVKRFLHVSSVAAIGRKPNQREITEKDRWEGTKYDSIYARSKHLQELEVWRGAQEGLEVKIINPSVVLGPGLWGQGGSTSVFHYAYNEKAFHPAGHANFVDVRDVAEIAVKLLESDIHGERFILNAGSLPYKEFFGTIARSFGKKPPAKEVKPWMLRVAVALEFVRSRITGKEAMITKDTAILSRSRFHFSNQKIKKTLGVEFRSFEESVDWTIAELKNRYQL